MIINGCGVLESFQLLTGFFYDVRMAVPDADGNDTTETIQVTTAVFIIEILHGTLYNHYRILVVCQQCR